MSKVHIFVLCFICLSSVAQGQIFVDQNAVGAENGSSWQDAFTDLQDALSVASSGSEIWVANGIYYPSTGTDRNISFTMKAGVGIYGGFSGTETEIDERQWDSFETILSGDIGIKEELDDNAYHVIANKGNGLTSSAILDGFKITHGNAGDPEPNERGGGIFNKDSSPLIRNCYFTENYALYGGAIYNLGGSEASYINCQIEGNTAYKGCGGVYNFLNAHATMIQCRITGNEGLDDVGGGTYNFLSDPHYIDCLISGNVAPIAAGVYNTNNSNPVFTNCTIVANMSSDSVGGILNVASELTLENSVVWSNISENDIGPSSNLSQANNAILTAEYSLIEGVSLDPDAGNLDGLDITNDPSFLSLPPLNYIPTSDGDYSIDASSILIDAGISSVTTQDVDLLGNDRISGSQIDIGAIEYQFPVTNSDLELLSIRVYPNPADDHIVISGLRFNNVYTIKLLGLDGRLLSSQNISALNDTEVLALPNGSRTMLLQVHDADGKHYNQIIVKK